MAEMELVKRQLQKLLGREVQVEKLKSGKFICKYLSFNMHPLSLVGATEDEAYQNLLKYLQSQPKPEPEPDSAA
jgi:hypothetical protein